MLQIRENLDSISLVQQSDEFKATGDKTGKKKLKKKKSGFFFSISVLIAGVSFDLINARHNFTSFEQGNKEDFEDKKFLTIPTIFFFF